MLTWLLYSLASSLLFLGLWRIFCGPSRVERPTVTVNVTVSREVFEAILAEQRAADEVADLERMVRR